MKMQKQFLKYKIKNQILTFASLKQFRISRKSICWVSFFYWAIVVIPNPFTNIYITDWIANEDWLVIKRIQASDDLAIPVYWVIQISPNVCDTIGYNHKCCLWIMTMWQLKSTITLYVILNDLS
jgi:hypothetical protein